MSHSPFTACPASQVDFIFEITGLLFPLTSVGLLFLYFLVYRSNLGNNFIFILKYEKGRF